MIHEGLLDFRHLFEASPDLYMIINTNFDIIGATDAYLKATLVEREKTVGRPLFEVFPDNPNDPNASGVANLRRSLVRAFETKLPDAMAVQKYDIRRPESEGGGFEERFWSVTNNPVLDAHGKVLYAIHRAEDVTEFVRMKSKVEKTENEVFLRAQQIQEANAKLEVLYRRAQELDEIKTQFFANVSHELRTPLTLILGNLEQTLKHPELSADSVRQLEVVDRNARILLHHVNDLLDVMKLEAKKLRAEYSKIEIAGLSEFLRVNFQPIAEQRGIAWSVSVPPNLVVEADAGMLQKILLNLLSNAFKFVPDQGEIRLDVLVSGNRTRFTVSDNGPGIPEKMREAIFERFRQLEGGSNRRYGGTGLGLAIAKEFAELHRGSLRVEETPGGGATFTLEIPSKAPSDESLRPGMPAAYSSELVRQSIEELRQVPKKIHIERAAGASSRPSVLIVEDNPEMNEFIFRILQDEFEVMTAFDGNEGLEKAVRYRPDLILTDVMMPRMSGDEMIAELRQKPDTVATPVMVLTAKAEETFRTKILSSQAQDYLQKPFSSEELLARVHNLVMMKRLHDRLQTEVDSQAHDIESMVIRLATKKRRLQEALDESERLSRVKTNFLNLVSHETRTPLNIMQLQLYTLREELGETLDPFHRQLIENLFGSSKRIQNLMESLLNYAKISSGRVVLTTEEVDLRDIIADVVSELSPWAAEKKLALRSTGEKPIPMIQTDRELVRLVLTNLVSNAIKYTDRGKVEVAVSYENDEHRISVRDTGHGIAKEDQALLFREFEQLEGVQRKHHSGVGLGLAIAKRMIESLGGRIELDSDAGRGSTFIAILPKFVSEPKTPSPEPTQETDPKGKILA